MKIKLFFLVCNKPQIRKFLNHLKENLQLLNIKKFAPVCDDTNPAKYDLFFSNFSFTGFLHCNL